MNKEVFEFINVWMRSQKEFMESWMNSQREFMEKWLEAMRQMQESMLSIGQPLKGTTAETQDVYRSWLESMTGSAKVFTDEAGKVQKTWKTAIEKQMDMNKEVMKNFSEFFKKAEEKK